MPAAPAVSTGGASEVSANDALITGVVDPHGVQSTYEFDIGTDTSYGAKIFGNTSAGNKAEPFSASLQSLQPGTTYHYRITATNAYGTTYGADETFTTPSVPTALITAPPTPPLIATQPVTFPNETKPTTTTIKTKKPAKKKKKSKAKKESKPKKRGKK